MASDQRRRRPKNVGKVGRTAFSTPLSSRKRSKTRMEQKTFYFYSPGSPREVAQVYLNYILDPFCHTQSCSSSATTKPNQRGTQPSFLLPAPVPCPAPPALRRQSLPHRGPSGRCQGIFNNRLGNEKPNQKLVRGTLPLSLRPSEDVERRREQMPKNQWKKQRRFPEGGKLFLRSGTAQPWFGPRHSI